MRYAFGPFEPDKSVFNVAVSGNVVNAFPVANGWGPMPGLSVISDMLPAACRGAAYVRDSVGNYTIIAATASRIYKLNTTDYSWDDISGPSAPYNLPLVDTWTFTVFGTKLLIHNIADPIQAYDIETGADCVDLPGSPPHAKYSWVSGDFLVIGSLSGSNGEKKIRWSGVNDIEFWTIGEKGADEQVLPEGEEIMGGFGEQNGFYVINRSAMHFFVFSPSSGYTFTRQTLNPKQGAISAHSIVSIGPGLFFYLSEDGFFSGAARKPIGAERVDKWFLSQVDMAFLGEVQGASDPYEKIIWWKYRKTDGTYRRLGYDWQLDRWCTTDLQVGEMMSLVTPGVTWDGLATLYSSIEEVTEPFDSRVFLGGRPTMATFTVDNKLAFFSGENLPTMLETARIEPDSLIRTFCHSARVITDASGYSVTDTVYAYHDAAGATSPPQTANRAGLLNYRQDGRLHKFSCTIPAGADWSIISDIDANFEEGGEQ
ncbi:hypothetical protein [Rhizobium rhizogenes]|uniref:hypothetical protein n=1 Tax=Rhizobium rhizogenes TaxID=359 RepID=UPI0022C8E92B|nr:hypothetical protein [Rhizobium rhizogenes]MCZ7480556.1 hypothetical protein [Rhizobium rhizogenes]